MASPGIKLTAKSFQAIEKSLDAIIKKAEEATTKITAMFDIDGSSMKTMNALKGIHGVLKSIQRQAQRNNSVISGGGGGGRGKGGSSPGGGGGGGAMYGGPGGRYAGAFGAYMKRFHQGSFMRYLNNVAFKTMFGGPNGLNQSIRGNNFLGLNLSRFQPGATGVVGRYRMFQKPFPGSDRNVFSLGDLGAAGQNIAYGAGSALENSFRAVTGSAIAVNKMFNGLVTTVATAINPVLGALVGTVGDVFIGMLESMSKAIAGVIGGLTNLGTALLGMATRAVEAASDLTEAMNAARVIAGQKSANEMAKYAQSIQRQYGLSQTDSLKIMGRMAGMMRNLGGFTQEEAGASSTQLYRAAVDIASVMNKSIEDVGMQLMSGFAGRLTPLRRSAIGLTAQQLDQQAKARGLNRPGVRTDLQARARMFIEEFSRQAGLFTGDLQRTQFEFANQRRKFLGQFEALFVTVGRILEPFAKAVLLAANDLMGMVLDLISPFANTIKDNMVEMTVMERFSQSIKTFAWYVLWAKGAIIELAKRVFESRGSIAEWAKTFVDAVGTIAVSLVKYSASVIDLFADFISRLGGIMPAIDMFASALTGLTDFITRHILGTNDSKVVDNKLSELFTTQNSLSNMLADNPNAAVKNTMAQNAQMIEALLPFSNFGKLVLFKNAKPIDQMPQELKDYLGIRGSATGPAPQAMKGFSSTLQSFAAKMDAAIKEAGVVVDPKALADLLNKIQPVESMANPLAPAPELSANRLVQYFNPASFRDALQESQRTPLQDTARNTGDILLLLQNTLSDAVNGNVRRKPEFNMLAPVTLP